MGDDCVEGVEWVAFLKAEQKLIKAGEDYIQACHLDEILVLPGYQNMKASDTKEFITFLTSEKPSLLAGGTYGAAKGRQGYESKTGQVILEKVTQDNKRALYYIDMFWMFVDTVKSFDEARGPELWNKEAYTELPSFQTLLEAMEQILECIILLRMRYKPKGSIVFMCLGDTVGKHWSPIGKKLEADYKNFKMDNLPCHPCRYFQQDDVIKKKFKDAGLHVNLMLDNFDADGNYLQESGFEKKMIAQKLKHLDTLTELGIPHNDDGWLSKELRMLRNIDLVSKKTVFTTLKTELKDHFLKVLGLPGFIRRVCYIDDYMDTFLNFVEENGIDYSCRLLSGAAGSLPAQLEIVTTIDRLSTTGWLKNDILCLLSGAAGSYVAQLEILTTIDRLSTKGWLKNEIKSVLSGAGGSYVAQLEIVTTIDRLSSTTGWLKNDILCLLSGNAGSLPAQLEILTTIDHLSTTGWLKNEIKSVLSGAGGSYVAQLELFETIDFYRDRRFKKKDIISLLIKGTYGRQCSPKNC